MLESKNQPHPSATQQLGCLIRRVTTWLPHQKYKKKSFSFTFHKVSLSTSNWRTKQHKTKTYSWGTEQEILVWLHGSFEESTLDSVETLEAVKGWLCKLGQSVNGYQWLQSQENVLMDSLTAPTTTTSCWVSQYLNCRHSWAHWLFTASASSDLTESVNALTVVTAVHADYLLHQHHQIGLFSLYLH